MRTKIPFVAIFFITSMLSSQLNAQLRVDSAGNVTIYKNLSVGTTVDTCSSVNIYKESQGTQTLYGIKSHIQTYSAQPSGSIYCLYGFADGLATTTHYSSLKNIVGVYGKALSSSTSGGKFTAGVAGVATTNRGVGIYGEIAHNADYTLPTSWTPASYAGYFSGSTKVVGTLTCTSLTQTSDATTKNNIQYIREDVVGKISQLKPISFYYNLDDRLFNAADVESSAAKQMHYGFSAQELQEVLPNIVYMGQDSILSINYIELIPLLVQVVQTQQQQIENLQNQVQSLTTK